MYTSFYISNLLLLKIALAIPFVFRVMPIKLVSTLSLSLSLCVCLFVFVITIITIIKIMKFIILTDNYFLSLSHFYYSYPSPSPVCLSVCPLLSLLPPLPPSSVCLPPTHHSTLPLSTHPCIHSPVIHPHLLQLPCPEPFPLRPSFVYPAPRLLLPLSPASQYERFNQRFCS